MRSLDTRHWNILAPAALLALTACGPQGLSLDGEGEGGDGDGDTESGDGDGDDDPECVVDNDCPSYYYCANGYCQYEYWCGQPLPHHPGSVAGDPEHPVCSPPYECYSDDDCSPDESCVGGYCEFDPYLDECGALGLTEIPLPDDALIPVLDLAFANLDDDPQAELVLLAADDLVIVDDNLQTVHLGPFEPGEPVRDQLTALRADDDDRVDLLITASQDGSGVLWLGTGPLAFSPVSGGPATPIERPIAVDWPSGGRQELLGIEPGGSMAMVFTALEQPQPPVDPIGPSWGPINDVGVGQFFAPGDSIVTSERCAVVLRGLGTGSQVIDLLGIDVDCTIAVGQLDGSDVDDVVSLATVGGETLLVELRNFEQFSQHNLPSAYHELEALDLEGDGLGEVVLIGPGSPGLVHFSSDGAECLSDLPDAPVANDVAVGDFDGDGGHELGFIDEAGQAHLFDG